MYERLNEIFKALGDRNRLRIINMLLLKPLCVCEITYVLKLSQSTVSEHLKVLNNAGLIKNRKDGLWVEYSLSARISLITELLKVIKKNFEKDKTFLRDRRNVLKADRNVICRK